jgi:hypothetical protein
MKKLLSLFLISSMFFVACSDDTAPPTDGGGTTDPFSISDVAKKNTSFVVKHTGTKCPPCGSWGWDMFAEFIDNIGDDAVYMAPYSYPGIWIIPAATQLASVNGVKGYPTFAANNEAQLSAARAQGKVNTAEEKQMVYDVVNAFVDAPVLANTALIYKIEDGAIQIKYKAKAFQDLTGTTQVAIYLLENKVVGEQSGHPDGNEAVHKHVMRKAVGDKVWGESITTLASGEEYDSEEMIILDSAWDESHLEIVVVMYSKKGTNYTFINASKGTLITE